MYSVLHIHASVVYTSGRGIIAFCLNPFQRDEGIPDTDRFM